MKIMNIKIDDLINPSGYSQEAIANNSKPEEAHDYFVVEKDFHTKKEIDIWKIKLSKQHRITRVHFTQLKQEVKQLNGYYSHYSRAFIFETEPTQEQREKFSATIKIMIHQEKSVENDQQEYSVDYRPLSKSTERQYNMARWTEVNINDDFETSIKQWEAKLKDSLNIDTLNKLPATLREKFDQYQKKLREYYERMARANAVYPNPYVTGRSGYKNMDYKREKANRLEKRAMEDIEKASERMERALKEHLNRQFKRAPKPIDFVAENLNKEISQIRKEFKGTLITIRKTTSGSVKGRRHATYYIELTNGEYQLQINEQGYFWFHAYNDFRNRNDLNLNSVEEMMQQLRNQLNNEVKP